MKITYLRLKNFAGIFASMKKKDIKYDFSILRNRIVLFIGSNGSGKTTVLSTLHPFAYPGSMDIRNGSGIILEGEQGIKEIHYKKDNKDIIIKHVYTPTKTGHSVKSFICIDGEEKNPNGNVSSFASMVETFLDIEPDYLKLTRLGANVTGLITMKSTERKGFTSSMLSDVDVYTGFYKKINNDTREIKIILKSLSDKLTKLNISDIEVEVKDIENLVSELNVLTSERETLNSKLAVVNFKLTDIIPEGEDINETIRAIKAELKETTKTLSKTITELDKVHLTDSKENLEDTFKKLYESKVINNEQINQLITNIDDLSKQKHKYDSQISMMSDTTNIELLTQARDSLITKINNIDNLPKSSIELSKLDLLNLVSISQEIDRLLGNLSSFDDELVLSTLSLINNGRNINDYIYQNVDRIDRDIARLDKQLIEVQEMYKTETTLNILYELHDDCHKCPYYKKVNNADNDKPKADFNSLKAKKQSLLKQRETYLSIQLVKDYIHGILSVIESNKSKISKLNYNPFSIQSLIKTRHIDIKFIYDAIEYCELQEEKQLLVMDMYKIEKEISLLSSVDSMSTILTILSKLNEDIQNYENKMFSLKAEKKTITALLTQCEEDLETYRQYEILTETKNVLTSEYDRLIDKLSDYEKKQSDVASLLEEKKSLYSLIHNHDISIRQLTNILETKRYNYIQYEELTKESNILNEKYEELSILREALSSNKGIPLLFIQLYLKNTRILANKLLQNVFEGDLEISEFVINDKEFNIPYSRHGIEVSDVSFASQGETSFLSIALSFALMQQSLKSYNVMLLDEIDATLDQINRNTFISILEQQLEDIGCEQVFMITHNNVFDNYPVDIVKTSDVEIDNYKNIGNIIE